MYSSVGTGGTQSRKQHGSRDRNMRGSMLKIGVNNTEGIVAEEDDLRRSEFKLVSNQPI